MSYVDNKAFAGPTPIQELGLDEIDAVNGAIAWVPIIIGGALLVTAGTAVVAGWKAEHNNDEEKN